MNSLEEARQDKINAQIELDEVRNEFKSWKKLNGIKLNDEVYKELKQAEIAATENYNKALELYSKLLSSAGHVALGKSNSYGTIETVNVTSSSPQPLATAVPQSAGLTERSLCERIFKFGPPRIDLSMKNVKPYFKVPVKWILLILCLYVTLVSIIQIAEGYLHGGIVYCIPCWIGLLALGTSNPNIITLYGWATLLDLIIAFIANLINTGGYYYRPPIDIIMVAALQVILGSGYLYCIQRYYFSVVKKEAVEGDLETGPLQQHE